MALLCLSQHTPFHIDHNVSHADAAETTVTCTCTRHDKLLLCTYTVILHYHNSCTQSFLAGIDKQMNCIKVAMLSVTQPLQSSLVRYSRF